MIKVNIAAWTPEFKKHPTYIIINRVYRMTTSTIQFAIKEEETGNFVSVEMSEQEFNNFVAQLLANKDCE